MQPVAIPVTYRRTWPDGFGARGWKLDVTLDDPEIIASTAYHGGRIPTSVLIHDMLDHFVSGFRPSGHRAEAMALAQLAVRTGSDIRPDYEQMVDEDLMQGRVLGEPLEEFLPDSLLRLLPPGIGTNAEKIVYLSERFGHVELRTALVARFYELGAQGLPMARRNWRAIGLDYTRSSALGLCLQRLLEAADAAALAANRTQAHGCFVFDDTACRLMLDHGWHRAEATNAPPGQGTTKT
ncbi:MAG: hypothetical protein ACOY5C_08085 [Pseudomonadota bacterium]